MAEVVKAGFIADPAILDLVDDDPEGARHASGPHARELVERAIRVKADVVARDIREAGPREALNYGHTVGHAIERVSGYAVPHGHAVAVGMVFVAELSRRAGRLDATTAARHGSVLETVGLPTDPSALASGSGNMAWSDLRSAMAVDKKSRGGRLRFVVLDAMAAPAILEGPDDNELAEIYRGMTP
jgi:3-dehydroquinate synthase